MGTYAATSLQPLPDRVVKSISISAIRSPRTDLMLADRFLKEYREAGVAVGQGRRTCYCTVSTSRLGETSSGTPRGAEQDSIEFRELGGLRGRWDAAQGCRPCLRRA